jgi:hypothetical protein
MMMRAMTLFASVMLFGSANTVFANPVLQSVSVSSAEELHQQACSAQAPTTDNPWHITQLYDCLSKKMFVPYQLWSGGHWSGDKQASCMHEVNQSTPLIRLGDDSQSGDTIIRGPILWEDPHTGEKLKVWERRLDNYNSLKYYACHKRGIGIVHNLNKPHINYIRGLCRAPAGFGWKIGQRRTCIKTTVEIINVTLDENGDLDSLTTNYWFRDKLSYRYTYKPNKGVVSVKRY